jgi:phosphate transport system substrate-binding protein
VKQFVSYYLAKAPSLVAQVNYVPLPTEAYELATEHFRKGKLGTAFAGEAEVSMKIEDLLRRESRL